MESACKDNSMEKYIETLETQITANDIILLSLPNVAEIGGRMKSVSC